MRTMSAWGNHKIIWHINTFVILTKKSSLFSSRFSPAYRRVITNCTQKTGVRKKFLVITAEKSVHAYHRWHNCEIDFSLFVFILLSFASKRRGIGETIRRNDASQSNPLVVIATSNNELRRFYQRSNRVHRHVALYALKTIYFTSV